MSTGSSQLPTASTGEQAVPAAIRLGMQGSRTEQVGSACWDWSGMGDEGPSTQLISAASPCTGPRAP